MKFALFGAGLLGELFYSRYKDEYDIVCFIDNNPEKQGTKYLSLDVLSPDCIKPLELNVIISSLYQFEIVRQLYNMEIKEFYSPSKFEQSELMLFSLAQFENIEEISNKICIIRRENNCSASIGLVQGNPYSDLELVVVNGSNKDNLFYYHILTSSLVITQFCEATPEDKKSIEIWHGFPFKAIGFMVKSDYERLVFERSHPFLRSKNAFCSLSHLYSILTGYCFNLEAEKFHITGYPRNDLLFTSAGLKLIQKLFGVLNNKKVIIYLPTFREREFMPEINGENAFIFNMPGYDENDFNAYLEENNILFIYKMHTTQIDMDIFRETKNIRILSDEKLDSNGLNLYQILNGTDCLISDYSSVIIDYLLVDKPMVFTPTDLEEYSKNRGLMLEPFDAWMPGEIALDYGQLKAAISNALFGEDGYAKDRERLRRITHKYTDGNSTKRVLALARRMLGMDSEL